MTICRQTWCWRSQDFCILFFRQKKETAYHTTHSLSTGDLKTHPNSDTLPPTRPHLLIVPLPVGQAFKHMSLWAPFLLKPSQECKFNSPNPCTKLDMVAHACNTSDGNMESYCYCPEACWPASLIYFEKFQSNEQPFKQKFEEN